MKDEHVMDDAAVTDLILRAIAAMRERGDLPELDTPTIQVSRMTEGSTARFSANVGQALAAAQTGAQAHQGPRTLASAVADYLSEVVDLVPAYHDVASIVTSDDGSIAITLRDPETR